ncbi:MAG: hypothetical protein JNM56_28040, partial [Planctomycetia bacterium]|nr:hypothetical protein [Planctomycetia bacterium]
MSALKFSLMLLLILGAVQAQQPAKPVPPTFAIHTAAGAPVKGVIASINDKWTVLLAGTLMMRIDGNDFIALRRVETPLPAPPAGPHVRFVNGDCLSGTIGELNGEKLGFTAHLGAG